VMPYQGLAAKQQTRCLHCISTNALPYPTLTGSIVPWGLTHNDDPRNGMALCRLCYWTFDEGLKGSDIDRITGLRNDSVSK